MKQPKALRPGITVTIDGSAHESIKHGDPTGYFTLLSAGPPAREAKHNAKVFLDGIHDGDVVFALRGLLNRTPRLAVVRQGEHLEFPPLSAVHPVRNHLANAS